jgi:glycosyltransferase involved in cell wall biosynthesis
MISQIHPLVSIACITYNQAEFINQTLDGFLKQIVNFPYEIIIHDDASSDDTVKIIQEYCSKFPNKIKPIFQLENQYNKGHGILDSFVFPVCKGKYIALCEGDDYWTDPYKLQKQVDFMEANPDYSLSFHKVKILSDNIKSSELYIHLREREFTGREVFDKWTIPTCSVLFRNLIKYEFPKFVVLGDIFLFLTVLEHGKAYCHGFEGGVYRRHVGGVSVRPNSQMLSKIYYQYKYMAKRFPQYKDIANRKKNDYLDQLIYAPFFKGIWKFRFYKLLQEPKLFFSSFFTTTLTSYIIQRKKT